MAGNTTRSEANQSFFVVVRDPNTGVVRRVAIPGDLQIGLEDQPAELHLLGRLSLAAQVYAINKVNKGLIGISNNDTVVALTLQDTPLSGRITCTLPPDPRDGQIHFIKDYSGTASTVPIDVIPSPGTTIDNATSKTLNDPYGSLALIWLENQWRVLVAGIGSSGGSGAPTNASYVTINSETSLSAERRLTGSANILMTDQGPGATVYFNLSQILGAAAGTYTYATVTVDAFGRVTGITNGAAVPPGNASYLTAQAESGLSSGRVMSGGLGTTVSDGGAGSTFSFHVNPQVIPFLTGANVFTSPNRFSAGLSGSLTRLADGTTPYIIGIGGVTITTGSNGQIIISGSSGGSGGSGGSGSSGGGDPGASYLTITNTGSLTNERRLLAGYGLNLQDGGPNDAAILSFAGSLSGSGIAGINISGSGTPIAGNPYSNLNFTGAGVSVTPAGNGVATINIPGASGSTGGGSFTVVTGSGRINYHDTTYSPVGLWQLSGSLIDSGSQVTNLTVGVGTERYSNMGPGLRGFMFDGSTMLVNTASVPTSMVLTGACTLEMLAIVEPSTSPQALFTLGGLGIDVNGSENYLLRLTITADGALDYFAEFGSGTNIQFTGEQATIPWNQLCHVAMTRSDSNVVRFYVNGSLLQTSTALTQVTTGSAPSTARVQIGGSNNGSFSSVTQACLKTSIASVKLINRQLTDAEIAAEYQRTLGNLYVQTSLVTQSITYAWLDTGHKLSTTASVAISNGTENLHDPSLKGQDVYFYVSGTVDQTTSSNPQLARVALFGGDVRISGSLTVGSGSVKVTSNDVQFGGFGTRIEREGDDLKFYDGANPDGWALSELVGGGGDSGSSAPVNVTYTQTFTYTGTTGSFVVPDGVTELRVKMWGAGGGTGNYGAPRYGAGAGGMTEGTFKVTPGETLYYIIGGGGQGTTGSSGDGGFGGWGGGGFGTKGDASGGGGGGYTGIFSGAIHQQTAIMIAGGGGGGTGWCAGGGGGGTTGRNAPAANGTGGTQSAAGGPTPGGPLYGGKGGGSRTVTSANDDGGGGGGYFGGGGGTGDGSGGGGGSGYLNTGSLRLAVGSTSQGSDGAAAGARSNPAGYLDSDYLSLAPANTATGGGATLGNGQDGGHGFMVIRYTVTVGNAQAYWLDDNGAGAFITSSVAIGTGTRASNAAGQEAFFYVSGTIGTSGSQAKKSIFGGDVYISGTFAVTGNIRTFAQRGNPGIGGRRIFITDSGTSEWLDDGVQWRPIINGVLGYQPPPSSSWSYLVGGTNNDGGSVQSTTPSITDNNGQVVVSITGVEAKLHPLLQSGHATDVIACIVPQHLNSSASAFPQMQLILRENATGKMAAGTIVHGTATADNTNLWLTLGRWANVNTRSAVIDRSIPGGFGPLFIRLRSDGATGAILSYSYNPNSPNGWVDLITDASVFTSAPNSGTNPFQCGVSVETETASMTNNMWIKSYRQT